MTNFLFFQIKIQIKLKISSMENQERISSLSMFSSPPPLASFLTNQSPGNLNFLDSINTTPVLNQ